VRTWSSEAREAIIDGTATGLTGSGFLRVGDWYRRDRGQLSDYVWFELSQYRPESDDASVDVRYGIHIGEVEEIDFGIWSWGNGPPCHTVRQGESFFRVEDVWWDPSSSSSTVLRQINGTVQSSALPFFDQRFRSIDQILNEFERDYLNANFPREQVLRVLTPRQKMMAMRIRLARGERDLAEDGFRRLCSDRAEARALGLPDRDPLVEPVLRSIAEDARFQMS
jgi:hypothetical protein